MQLPRAVRYVLPVIAACFPAPQSLFRPLPDDTQLKDFLRSRNSSHSFSKLEKLTDNCAH
jgi:hypothetical protein